MRVKSTYRALLRHDLRHSLLNYHALSIAHPHHSCVTSLYSLIRYNSPMYWQMVFFVMMVIKGMSYALNNPTKEILYQVSYANTSILFYLSFLDYFFLSLQYPFPYFNFPLSSPFILVYISVCFISNKRPCLFPSKLFFFILSVYSSALSALPFHSQLSPSNYESDEEMRTQYIFTNFSSPLMRIQSLNISIFILILQSLFSPFIR